MCGIVGYVGDEGKTVNVLMEGLSRLEYRGYDSAGIALMENGHPRVFRSTGKLENLKKKLESHELHGALGIGHTRWATHGGATENNAHPHTSGGTSVVHNGIIENYSELKEELAAMGYEFSSDTDTEIIAHLIEDFSRRGMTFEEAFRAALMRIEGSYAVAAISESEPDKVIATRRFSPLIVGCGEHENFLASDVPAVLPFCRDVIFLEDGDVVVLGKDSIVVTDLQGGPVDRKIDRINWDPVSVEKCGYRHYMLKEIHEQPQAVLDTMRGRFSEDTGEIYFDGLDGSNYKNIERIVILACGTSFHASLIGKYMIETVAHIPVQVEIASEFRYRNPIIDNDPLAIAVSQSGETADTSEALTEAKTKGAETLAITNVLMSKIARDADGVIYTHAGPEIGVASTKAFTTQLIVFYFLALYLGQIKKTIGEAESRELLRDAIRIPQLIQITLGLDDSVRELAQDFFQYRNFLYLGRGISHPVAYEGALKLKEVSYIHAEGYAAGEMKHGPIALIDEDMPVVLIAPNDGVTFKKILGNLQEIRARRGKVIFVTSSGAAEELRDAADRVVIIPESSNLLSPVISVIPLQLLAYHIANFKGTDVDQPRNLAKVVTVE